MSTPAVNETELVKNLREKTGAGILDCRAALKEAGWDIEKALDGLRKKGLQIAAKRGGRETKCGKVESYIHGGGKIGVMVEVNCETDFVARTEDFARFVKDVAMQAAATNAKWVDRAEVPADVVAREKAIYAETVKGKPANIVDKIVEGKLDKFFSEVCLSEQIFIKNDKTTIQQLLTEIIAKTGENVRIKRFAKFTLGE